MKTRLASLVLPAVLAVASAVQADPPMSPSVGKVLLLRNDRALEGEIERVGGQYRVKRGSGEVWVANEQAVQLCADWNDAYVYMKGRTDLSNPDERLRLARWCNVNQLGPQALEEARAVL